MRAGALVRFHFRLTWRCVGGVGGLAIALAIFLLGAPLAGLIDPSRWIQASARGVLFGLVAAVVTVQSAATHSLVRMLPVSPRAFHAARLLVLPVAGIPAVVGLVLARTWGAAGLSIRVTNLFLAGFAGLCLIDVVGYTSYRLGRVSQWFVTLLVLGVTVGVVVGISGHEAMAGFGPTPWLFGLAAILFGTAVTCAGRAEAVRPEARRGDSVPEEPRSPSASLARLVWDDPGTLGAAAMVLVLAPILTLLEGRYLDLLVGVVIVGMGFWILVESLEGYRRVFALPLAPKRAFRFFFAPAWTYVATCLALRGSVSVATGSRAGAALAEAAVYLVLATLVLRITLSEDRKFRTVLKFLAPVALALFFLGVFRVVAAGDAAARAWQALVQAGGGAGAYVVAAAAVAATALLLVSSRRAFDRLEWERPPPS